MLQQVPVKHSVAGIVIRSGFVTLWAWLFYSLLCWMGWLHPSVGSPFAYVCGVFGGTLLYYGLQRTVWARQHRS